MGITKNCAKFLSYATTKGVSFSDTIMLGRQELFVTPSEFRNNLSQFNISHAKLPESFQGQFAEPLFQALGSTVIDSMDISTFEKATVIHDLNLPIPETLKRKYTVVFDGGTLEHVFHFPQAIKNCMDMLQVNGHFISITPTNNQCGHGFYQFSPELFFSLFEAKHGFKIKMIAIGVDTPHTGLREWYEVASPHVVKRRVTLSNSLPTYLMIIAQKVGDTENVHLRPMQSDYQLIWEVYDSIKNDVPITKESVLLFYYRKYVPESLKSIVRKVLGRSNETLKNVDGLGNVNPTFFKKMKI
jgi:hypothetical protein